jgi:hypothetical protein
MPVSFTEHPSEWAQHMLQTSGIHITRSPLRTQNHCPTWTCWFRICNFNKVLRQTICTVTLISMALVASFPRDPTPTNQDHIYLHFLFPERKPLLPTPSWGFFPAPLSLEFKPLWKEINSPGPDFSSCCPSPWQKTIPGAPRGMDLFPEPMIHPSALVQRMEAWEEKDWYKITPEMTQKFWNPKFYSLLQGTGHTRTHTSSHLISWKSSNPGHAQLSALAGKRLSIAWLCSQGPLRQGIGIWGLKLWASLSGWEGKDVLWGRGKENWSLAVWS